jgi:hypothetical protein
VQPFHILMPYFFKNHFYVIILESQVLVLSIPLLRLDHTLQTQGHLLRGEPVPVCVCVKSSIM